MPMHILTSTDGLISIEACETGASLRRIIFDGVDVALGWEDESEYAAINSK